MPGTIPANKREDVFVNGADFHATFLAAAQVAYPEQGRAWPPLQPSWDAAGRDVPGARLFDGVAHWPTLAGGESRRRRLREGRCCASRAGAARNATQKIKNIR